MPRHIVQAEGNDQVPMAGIQSALQASFQAYAARQAEGQRAAQAAQHPNTQGKQRQCKQVSLDLCSVIWGLSLVAVHTAGAQHDLWCLSCADEPAWGALNAPTACSLYSACRAASLRSQQILIRQAALHRHPPATHPREHVLQTRQAQPSHSSSHLHLRPDSISPFPQRQQQQLQLQRQSPGQLMPHDKTASQSQHQSPPQQQNSSRQPPMLFLMQPQERLPKQLWRLLQRQLSR